MPLEQLSPGQRGEITAISHCGSCGCRNGSHHEKSPHHATRAEKLGLRVGTRVKMLDNTGDLLTLLVDDDRIAVDRAIARSVSVRGMAAAA